jgi:hypothetical protein
MYMTKEEEKHQEISKNVSTMKLSVCKRASLAKKETMEILKGKLQ